MPPTNTFFGRLKWLLCGSNTAEIHAPKVPSPQLSLGSTNTVEAETKLRVSIHEARNGRILEVSKYAYNPHGPDWIHELHVVRPDQSLADAVTAALVLHSLEK